MEAKFLENFKLSDFKSYLQYFEFYINDIVLKTFENSPTDNKLYGNAENLHSLIRGTQHDVNGNAMMLLLKYIQQRW